MVMTMTMKIGVKDEEDDDDDNDDDDDPPPLQAAKLRYPYTLRKTADFQRAFRAHVGLNFGTPKSITRQRQGQGALPRSASASILCVAKPCEFQHTVLFNTLTTHDDPRAGYT